MLMKHFTEAELRIENAPAEIKKNMYALVENVLDPLRGNLGKPIIITSGYRNPEYNKNVGGTKNSQHIKGQAVDFITSVNLEEVFKLIIKHFEFDQVIFEKSDNGSRWIHVSYSLEKNRRECLIANKINGKWKYTKY